MPIPGVSDIVNAGKDLVSSALGGGDDAAAGGTDFASVIAETRKLNEEALQNTLAVTNETTKSKSEIDGARIRVL